MSQPNAGLDRRVLDTMTEDHCQEAVDNFLEYAEALTSGRMPGPNFQSNLRQVQDLITAFHGDSYPERFAGIMSANSASEYIQQLGFEA